MIDIQLPEGGIILGKKKKDTKVVNLSINHFNDIFLIDRFGLEPEPMTIETFRDNIAHVINMNYMAMADMATIDRISNQMDTIIDAYRDLGIFNSITKISERSPDGFNSIRIQYQPYNQVIFHEITIQF